MSTDPNVLINEAIERVKLLKCPEHGKHPISNPKNPIQFSCCCDAFNEEVKTKTKFYVREACAKHFKQDFKNIERLFPGFIDNICKINDNT